jgi:S1-C subfamily serine protease
MTADLTEGSSGSGWVYDTAGHVVTNHHVVNGMGSKILIKPAGRPELVGTLRGTDPDSDLAVLAVPGLDADPLMIRQQPAVLGELCVALGSPFGLRESASLGMVSGLGRQLPKESGWTIEEVIQTDASINPGNSGGPLVDVAGLVLGVNTAKRGDAENIGFALPAEVVRDVVPELIKFGAVQRASIGVSIATDWEHRDGADRPVISVRRVTRADSPFEAGDVLLRIGDVPIRRRYDVRKALGRRSLGRSLIAQVERGGTVIDLLVTGQSRGGR